MGSYDYEQFMIYEFLNSDDNDFFKRVFPQENTEDKLLQNNKNLIKQLTDLEQHSKHCIEFMHYTQSKKSLEEFSKGPVNKSLQINMKLGDQSIESFF